MDCSLPGSSVHGIFQARILEVLPFPAPGDLPDLGIESFASLALAGRFFTREAFSRILYLGSPTLSHVNPKGPTPRALIITVSKFCDRTHPTSDISDLKFTPSP